MGIGAYRGVTWAFSRSERAVAVEPNAVKVWYRELTLTQRAYRHAGKIQRRAMQRRALQFASMCIHRSWRGSYSDFSRGVVTPHLPAAQVFLKRRLRKRPRDWGESPKAKFARTLCGASRQTDACFDVLMNRYYPNAQVSEVGQFALWLHRAYPRRHPREDMRLFETSRVEQDHCVVLRWIRTGRIVMSLRRGGIAK